MEHFSLINLLVLLLLVTQGSSASVTGNVAATIYGCHGDTITLPFSFHVDVQKVDVAIMSVHFQGKTIATLVDGLTSSVSSYRPRIKFVDNGNFILENVDTNDAGSYSLNVRNNVGKVKASISIDLLVANKVMYKGMQMVAQLRNKAEYNSDTKSFSLSMTCGDFIFKNENAPIDVQWITPDGSVKNSTKYSDGKFYLQLENPVKGGQYVCKIPEKSLTSVCAKPTDSTEVIVNIIDNDVQVILLDNEIKVLKEENENVIKHIDTLNQHVVKLKEQDVNLTKQDEIFKERNKQLLEQDTTFAKQDQIFIERYNTLSDKYEKLNEEDKELEEQNKKLQEQNEKLKKQFELLNDENKELAKQDELIKQQNKKISEEYEELELQVKHLNTSMAEAKKAEKVEEVEKKKAKSCEDWAESKSGTRIIHLPNERSATIYCDQDTEGGSWNVFQRRQDGSEDFYRGWSDYRNGFGDPNGEFWLGLETVHQMTNDGQYYELRFDLVREGSSKYHAVYDGFSIGSESEGYAVHFTGYTFRSNAGDSFRYHDHVKFSTKDRNNVDCATKFRGAWWYTNCHRSNDSNLNGLYNETQSAKGLVWYEITGWRGLLTKTEMKFRVTRN